VERNVNISEKPKQNKMKTYYDITINSQSGDAINIKGVSYSQMMKIVNDNPTLQKLEILKEYSKKISKYYP
jgi:hypothetical protein